MEELSVANVHDDGVENLSEEKEIFEMPALTQTDSFYRSQQEVDEAFKKRFASEKQKWEQEQLQNTNVAAKDIEPAADDRFSKDIENIRSQADELAQEYPNLDIASEIDADPMVAYMLAAGHSVRSVFELKYPGLSEERVSKNINEATLENIRARHAKPKSIGSGGANHVSRDMSAITDSEMKKIDEQVRRGVRVVL